MSFIPTHIEPGTREYDEKLSQPYYQGQDPRGYTPLTVVTPDGSEVTEQPPQWFQSKVLVARKVAAPSRRRGHTVARPRERRAHRSAKATPRAGPSDDDGPGEPEPQSSDALTFAVALGDHLRAFAGVLESEHRDLGSVSATAYNLRSAEVAAMRSTVHAFTEAELVAKAVGL